MSRTWWRKLAGKQTQTIRRQALRVEHLEDRVTPAGLLAVGSAAGASPLVTVFDASTRARLFEFVPYDPSVTTGVNVAVGDVNGDGIADIITAPGAGGGPNVKVFDGINGAELRSFVFGDDSSRVGVSVAAADFDADGLADILVGGVRNNQPLVQVLKLDGTVLRGYTPFEGTQGASVAAGDVNGDGTPDVIVGAGAGGTPRVTAFSGKDDAVLMNLVAFESTFTGGVRVSSADFNGNGRADVIAAAGNLGGPRVSVFSGADGAVIANFFAYTDTLRNGVSAYAVDSENNGTVDIVTLNGIAGSLDVRAYNPRTAAQLALPSFAGTTAALSTDRTAPTPTVTSGDGTATSIKPIPFTVAFNEAVTGFELADITVSNGKAANFQKVTAKTYTIDVTPTIDGAVTVNVALGAAFDAAGNQSAAGAFSRAFDSTPATLTVQNITTNQPRPTFRGTVSEGTALVQLTVAGQSLNANVSGTTWTQGASADIAPGTYPITVTATDAGGNRTEATGTLVIETTRPTATITSTAPDPTNTSPIPFRVEFSEAVSDFTQADLVVSKGTVANFQQVPGDAKTYTFDVNVTANAVVSVSFAENAAFDLAGNGNTAPTAVTRVYNGGVTAPTFQTVATNPTNLSPINFNVVFNSDVTGFEAADLVPTNGTISDFTKGSDSTYSFKFTPTNDGEIKIDIAAGAAKDAGTVDTAAGNYTGRSDRTVPTGTVTVANPTNTNPIAFTVEFSEQVTALINTGLEITNGSLVNITRVNDSKFTVLITPTTAGTVGLTVKVNAVQDTAANALAVAISGSTTYDPTLPAAPVITGLDPATDTGTPGDGVTSDKTPTLEGTTEVGSTVEVFQGTVSLGQATVTASGTWTFTPASDLNDGKYTVTAKAKDMAGNVSPASTSFALEIDSTPPVAPTIGLDPASDGGTQGDNITDDQSPTLVGTAEAGSLVRVYDGTTPIGLVEADTSGRWTFTVQTDLPEGVYTLTAKATDTAANESAPSAALSLEIDLTPP